MIALESSIRYGTEKNGTCLDVRRSNKKSYTSWKKIPYLSIYLKLKKNT
jgi:hypothetical protein